MITIRKYLYLTVILICSSHLFSQSTAQLDEKNGFKEFILGTPSDEYLKHDQFAMKGAKYVYVKKFMTVGNVIINSVRLEFAQGKLAAVVATLKYSDREKLFAILKEAYGEPNSKPYREHTEIDHQTNKIAYVLTEAKWLGNNVSLLLYGHGDPSSQYTTIDIEVTSKTMQQAIEQENKSQIKKGAKDL